MTTPPPKPAPSPAPIPVPDKVDWSPPKPKPKPSKYKGISIVGTVNGRPRYVSGDPNNEFNKYTWIRTKHSGYWRGLGPNKPTFNPDTGKPLELEEAEKNANAAVKRQKSQQRQQHPKNVLAPKRRKKHELRELHPPIQSRLDDCLLRSCPSIP